MPKSRRAPDRKHKTPSDREIVRRSIGTLAGRVSNRELRRRAQFSILHGRQAFQTLLAVLAQKGGEVVVTQGTIDQVNTNYNNLGFVVEQRGKSNEFVVKLTEGRAAEGRDDRRGEGTHDGRTDHASGDADASDLGLGRDQTGDVPASV